MLCHFCQKEVQTGERVGRRDACEHCSRDLHICRNCSFYDPAAYNECRESQADRVVEKDRSNFCDYFNPRQATQAGAKPAVDPKEEARRKLEELFKKK